MPLKAGRRGLNKRYLDPMGNPIGGSVGVTVEELSVTENGNYTAPTGKAYTPVVVNVPGITPTGNINITNMQSTDVSAYATAQVVDSDLVAGNIKKDVNILGVVGTYDGSNDNNLFVFSRFEGISITGGTVQWGDNEFTLNATATDCYTNYSNWSSSDIRRIPVLPGEKIRMTWDCETNADAAMAYIFGNGNTTSMAGSASGTVEYTVPASGVSYITYRFGVSGTGKTAKYSNIVITVFDE